jgi:acetate kinase
VDEAPNSAGATVISKKESGVTVRIIPTDEESQIARSVLQLLDEEPGQ